MSFTLNPAEPIRRGLKQVTRHQLRGADKRLRDNGEDAVHEARKSVKKVRAVVMLLRQTDADGLGRDERRLRAAAQTLSTLRDSEAVVATFDLLRTRFPKGLPEQANALIRRQLVRTRTRIAKKARHNRRLAHAAHTLRDVRRSIKHWRVPAMNTLDLPDLLKASYRASRKAMHRAEHTTAAPDLHRWRKRIKTLWYQLRLTESRAPRVRGEIQDLERLEAWLGEHNNLTVLQARIAADDDVRHRAPEALRVLVVMSGRLQSTLRRKSFALGRRLLTERPKAFARDLRRALSVSPTPKPCITLRASVSTVA